MKLILSDCPLSMELPPGNDVKHVDLSSLRIAHCVGCFGCWTRTPGKCVIRDDAVTVYPLIAQSNQVLYVSHVQYGGYDTIMKTMLERAIPVQQAFIRLLHGETHHIQRSVAPKQAVILAYGELSPEEQELFRRLVARNAHNMNFTSWDIRFCEESQLNEQVNSEVAKWTAS